MKPQVGNAFARCVWQLYHFERGDYPALGSVVLSRKPLAQGSYE